MSVVMSVLSCCRFTLWYCPIMLSLPWLLGVGLGLGFAEKKRSCSHHCASPAYPGYESVSVFPRISHLVAPESRENDAENDDDARRRKACRSCHLQRQPLRRRQVEVDEPDHLFIRYDTIRDAILTCARKPT